jgi:hypothetical protein
MKNKKLLPPDEQSLLLVSLLFARRHLDEIYSFFSAEQTERMNEAKMRFLRLEQAPRVTQIILELKRLLLIKEHNIRWIHPTWFEHELAKEPPYLRAIIAPLLEKKESLDKNIFLFISSDQILHNFLRSFLNTPQRVALFDPVLMRLQSLHRDQQDHLIKHLGNYALAALSHVVDRRRFSNYLRRYYNLNIISYRPKENIFENNNYKLLLLNKIINHHKNNKNLEVELGLWLIALYIHGYKQQWHRMIELVLERNMGMSIREKIIIIKNNNVEIIKNPSPAFLIDAMDQALISYKN